MTTDPDQIYLVIAQIAGAFAGFGSVASGLGHRRGADDARVDAHRLATMLFASLSATLLGLLPATLTALSVSPRWALGLPAILAILATLIYLVIGGARAYRIRNVPGFSMGANIANIGCALIGLAGFLLCALGTPADRLDAYYLVGLMGMLGSCVVMFSRVIASMLRPHSEPDAPPNADE
jgi:hypothetical protein